VLCNNEYETDNINFDQKLVSDKDFCVTCWSDIMSAESEEDQFRLVETK
jgi:hypothetical protein